MSFDSIPEDKELSFPCDCGGSITFVNGIWECNTCDFSEED